MELFFESYALKDVVLLFAAAFFYPIVSRYVLDVNEWHNEPPEILRIMFQIVRLPIILLFSAAIPLYMGLQFDWYVSLVYLGLVGITVFVATGTATNLKQIRPSMPIMTFLAFGFIILVLAYLVTKYGLGVPEGHDMLRIFTYKDLLLVLISMFLGALNDKHLQLTKPSYLQSGDLAILLMRIQQISGSLILSPLFFSTIIFVGYCYDLRTFGMFIPIFLANAVAGYAYAQIDKSLGFSDVLRYSILALINISIVAYLVGKYFF